MGGFLFDLTYQFKLEYNIGGVPSTKAKSLPNKSMTYKLERVGGATTTYNDRETYVQAYENQLRVEALRTNRRGYVTEEMQLPPDVAQLYAMSGPINPEERQEIH